MKKLALISLLCLLAIASLVWGGLGTEEGADLAELGSSGTETVSETPSGAPGPSGPAQPDPGKHPELRDRRWITVTGRCIGATLGAPLAACQVTVAARATYTDSRGGFSLRIERPESRRIVLSTRMNGRADVEGSLALQGGQDTLDIGDIPIPRGVRLLARVVDERGQALPGVGVRFIRQTRDRQPTFRPRSLLRSTSDAGGVLALDAPIECGTWSIHSSREFRLIRPEGLLEVLPGPPVQEARIVVRSPDPDTLISGKVIDTQGSAVPNTRIQGESESTIRYGATDEKGEFLLQRGDSNDGVRLAIRGRSGFEDLRTRETYAWGSRGIVLRLERAGRVTVTVLESGRPVEDYRLSWCKIDEDGSVLHGSRGVAGRHPEGRVTVEGVPRGRIRMVVTPTGEGLAPGDPVEFVKAEELSELRIELKRRMAVPVELVFRDGRPVPGSELELLQTSEGQAPSLGTYGMDPSRYFRLTSRGPYALLLDRTRTDSKGHATLRWPVSGRALAIRVLGPGHVPLVEGPVLAGKGSLPIRITVDSGATLTGVVRPLSVLEALGPRGSGGAKGVQGPTIVLTHLGRNAAGRPHGRRTARLDGAGAFRFTGLREGTWTVMFRVLSFDSRRASNLGSKQFAPLTLGGGEQRRVEYDISDLRPAVLRGQVMLDGVPLGKQRIDLLRVRIGKKGTLLHAGSSIATTDGSGSFRAGGLQPGRYRVSIPARATRGGRADRLACPETVDLLPGAEASRIFHIRTGGLELLLRDEDGKPVAGRHLLVHNLETGFRTAASSDADGLLRIERIAAGSYTVSVKLRGGGLEAVTDVTVAPGPRASSFRITLPAK